MNGPMSAVVPDVVEQEVDNYRRTSFKLEKTFSDVPAPKKIASKVSGIEPCVFLLDIKHIYVYLLTLCCPCKVNSHKVTSVGFC